MATKKAAKKAPAKKAAKKAVKKAAKKKYSGSTNQKATLKGDASSVPLGVSAQGLDSEIKETTKHHDTPPLDCRTLG